MKSGVPRQDEPQASPVPAVPDDVRAALRRALEGGSADGEESYQLELPARDVPAAFDPPAGLAIIFLILKIFFYLVVAAGLAGLAVALFRSWRDRRRPDAVALEEEPESSLAGARVEIDLESVRALARAGDHGDAIHRLLLLTFRSLCELAGTDLRPAWTSREILAEIPLPPAAGDALRALVQAVELSHFGGVAPTREDYERAMDRFESFVGTLRGEKVS